MLDNIAFLETENDALIAYAKQSGSNTVIAIVNIDCENAQEGVCVVPAGLNTAPVMNVEDILSGDTFTWRIGPNYVRLEPGKAHVVVVSR